MDSNKTRAIAIVRKAHKLNQDGIDGISDRHLRRIENEALININY
ncbi:MAG: hypothetical protein ACFCU5_04380 [Pleurocapsa sp.]